MKNIFIFSQVDISQVDPVSELGDFQKFTVHHFGSMIFGSAVFPRLGPHALQFPELCFRWGVVASGFR